VIAISPYDLTVRSSTWTGVKNSYVKAVLNAGGSPFLLSQTCSKKYIQEAVSMSRGILMVGGPDVPPEQYSSSNPNLISHKMSTERFNFDSALFDEAIKQNKKVLAICASMQLINVYKGGTLYEDINRLFKNNINHGVFRGKASEHSVKINRDSRLYQIIKKDNIYVKSSHHQCIKEVGTGIEITGNSEDGMIESFELVGYEGLIAVQWHPEITYSEESKMLFEWLVK